MRGWSAGSLRHLTPSSFLSSVVPLAEASGSCVMVLMLEPDFDSPQTSNIAPALQFFEAISSSTYLPVPAYLSQPRRRWPAGRCQCALVSPGAARAGMRGWSAGSLRHLTPSSFLSSVLPLARASGSCVMVLMLEPEFDSPQTSKIAPALQFFRSISSSTYLPVPAYLSRPAPPPLKPVSPFQLPFLPTSLPPALQSYLPPPLPPSLPFGPLPLVYAIAAPPSKTEPSPGRRIV
mmetsp:Transcript_57493/g.186756  ORF Transcript_57493/g.186756 Transcript_57493/m.186756 type:complete len:234 (+) Transcript_57493:204-905(+)